MRRAAPFLDAKKKGGTDPLQQPYPIIPDNKSIRAYPVGACVNTNPRTTMPRALSYLVSFGEAQRRLVGEAH